MITLGFCPTEQRWCYFDPAKRIWYVTYRILGDIQRACLADPLYAEKKVMPHTGPGPIEIIVGRPPDNSYTRLIETVDSGEGGTLAITG